MFPDLSLSLLLLFYLIDVLNLHLATVFFFHHPSQLNLIF